MVDLESYLQSWAAAFSFGLAAYSNRELRDQAVFDAWDDAGAVRQTVTDWQGGRWQATFGTQEVKGDPAGIEVRLAVELSRGQAGQVALQVAFDFHDWDLDHYLLLPGAVYAGNRFECLPVPYPPTFEDETWHRLDLPITVADVARLNLNGAASRLEQTSADPATPALAVFSPRRQAALIILTSPTTRHGHLGYTVEECPATRTARITVTAPAMRQYRQALCARFPSKDRAPDWQAGDAAELTLRVHVAPARNVQDLFDRLAPLRKSLTGPTRYRPGLPWQAAFRIIEEKYNRQNWNDRRGYYRIGVRDGICFDWQLGWVGGGMASFALLAAGEPVSRQRAWQTLDTIISQTQRPTGFFYGLGNAHDHGLTDGPPWWSDGFDHPFPRNLQIIRRSGDALYFFTKHLLVLQQQPDAEPAPAWRAAIRRLADALVRLWDRYGQFGQWVDIETGELVVGGSTSGALIPAGLAVAAHCLEEPRFLEVAQAAARHYYERDVRRGLTTGGPSEILQAPDSESAFALLESFVVLYEMTGAACWLQAAEEMARQCATWVVSYDYAFPRESTFGKLGIASTGAVIANVQNKHGAPAICTLSGDALFKLFRATGNEYYLELIKDIAYHLTQYLSRTDRPVTAFEGLLTDGQDPTQDHCLEMPAGWINERVNLSDWEGAHRVGEVHHCSCWPEVSCLLTYVDLPGVYVRADLDRVWTLDHVEARFVERPDGARDLQLRNPTAFAAKIRVLIETAAQAGSPLGACGPQAAVEVALAAGQERQLPCP